MLLPEFSIAREINKKASGKNIPLSVQIELTYRCNLSCYYCYQKHFEKKADLPFAFWTDVLNQLSSAGSFYLTFTGGEPFVRDDFIDIVRKARAMDFAVSIISNGTLIDDKKAGALADLGLMDIGISIHSSDKTKHDEMTGVPGSFNKALAAIRALKSAGINVLIKHTVSAKNFGEYQDLKKMADNEGFLLEADSLVSPMEQGIQSPWALSQAQQKEFLDEMETGAAPQNSETVEAQLHCDAGRSVCGITPTGDVVPCVQLPITLGNLGTQRFSDIWQGRKAEEFRYDEKRILAECVSCGVNAQCSRCHGMALLETGEWKGKSPSLCSRAKAMMKE
jgi:AdoMet-dependent heme synthase